MTDNEFGRYRLLDLLGRGGMGEVWRAQDSVTGRVVAVKMLLPQFTSDEEFQRRFRAEARTAASLSSPMWCDPRFRRDRRTTRRRHGLISGSDLASLLADGPLQPARAVHIIGQVAGGTAAATAPVWCIGTSNLSNILVTPDDFVYLIDFGLARAADGTDDLDPR
jgi:serine/threonine-protein kinase